MMYEMMLFCFSGLSSFFFSFDDDDDDDDEHFPFLWNGQLGCHLSFGTKCGLSMLEVFQVFLQ